MHRAPLCTLVYLLGALACLLSALAAPAAAGSAQVAQSHKVRSAGVIDLRIAQLYGGPLTARVTGVHEGRPVWTRLSRVDGCKIAR